ncbi:MAG: hypothetical protein MZU95_04095 [Desulfomicrobium escambiense]|nr:hypothetical protein [Desulfomicrobium escambiense]
MQQYEEIIMNTAFVQNYYIKIILASVCFLSLLISSITPTWAQAANNELQRLEKREILSRSLTKELKGGLRGAAGKGVYSSSPEKVWNLLDDPAKLPEYVSRFKKS